MFIYTRAYFKKLIDDTKKLGYIFNIVSPLIYIAYLIYSLFVPVGYLWANITLMVLTASYLVFYLVTYDIKTKGLKSKKKNIRHLYKGLKLSVAGMTLGITIYGIYVASSHTTTLSVVLSCFMAIFWICQVSIEILTYVLEYQTALFLAALEADKDNFIKPITTVSNLVKKVTGKEVEEPKEPKKILRALDKTVEQMREKSKNGSRSILGGLFGKIKKDDAIEVTASEQPEDETVTK